ncbi:MAG: tRNA 2-thiouridine(34) synthase MnmA [Lachnospiraceae bacterium]|nr:tRNA 2-thiouridine(34) synthase MnmA [Lachnospiraceae bacterium]
MNKNKKVVVGMSGGVDSSVAAFLLKKAGYDVIGVTMQIWQDGQQTADNGGCCGLKAADDARRVAEALDIPYYVMNFKDEFKKNVIDYFVAEYLCGRTPNPCIACNRYVKWDSLLNRSLSIGADYIATGHYARVRTTEHGRLAVSKSATAAKDQTYALYNLTQYQLGHTLMPIGDYAKEEVRQIAVAENLPVADKPDSQEICFIPDDDYAKFIAQTAETSGLKLPPQGNFVTKDGEVLGVHKGITHYTVGQRKGLMLSMGRRVFVTEIRPGTDEVVLGESEDVFSSSLKCNQLNFMGMADLKAPRNVVAKVRYAHQGGEAVIERIGEDKILCTFMNPVRAITPGQAAVFYDGDYVLGGGTIM